MFTIVKVKGIFNRYTDQVESFGIDEAWLDVSNSQNLFGDAESIAFRSQNDVLNELGLKISVGLSWNKIYAKLGSDLIKDMGFVNINEKNYKQLLKKYLYRSYFMLVRPLIEYYNEWEFKVFGILLKQIGFFV